MKINLCTIDMNEGEGRQTIYWDAEDKLLHSTAADPDQSATDCRCETVEEAQETAWALWGRSGSTWSLEWCEED